MATRKEFSNMKNEKKPHKKPMKEKGITSIQQLRDKAKKLEKESKSKKG